MKYWLLLVMVCFCKVDLIAQDAWQAQPIHLPAEIKEPENQFSGLFQHKGKLYLLAECRMLEKHEARIYSITTKEIDRAVTDSSIVPSYKKHPIVGLDAVVRKTAAMGETFEGLESVYMKGRRVYFTVEVATPSQYCFLVKGKMKRGMITLDTSHILAVQEPHQPDGGSIYNASFETMLGKGKQISLFFEYNHFPQGNYAYTYNCSLDAHSRDSLLMQPLPFRITDACYAKDGSITGINFFFKGGGKDTVYRPLASDNVNNALVKRGNDYRSYTRLISLRKQTHKFEWTTLYEFPEQLNGYNWEGIAPYKKGYLIINDKYTPAKPYFTNLVYIHP